jgi:hypothetical protein
VNAGKETSRIKGREPDDEIAGRAASKLMCLPSRTRRRMTLIDRLMAQSKQATDKLRNRSVHQRLSKAFSNPQSDHVREE